MKRIGTGARAFAVSLAATSLAATNLAAASLAAATFAILVSSAPGFAAAKKGDLQRGETLLAANCGRCHAIGKSGDSAHHLAPPFRILGQRYTIESLEEALGEGLISGHPDMPEFKFPPGDVGAIIDYLKSIQVPK
ncbi:MAG: c-type cytochrome [Xanthobacteraceae bacterium]|nr:MAG: c-type cytochrome [Xanthobacteraceae bacterium]